MTLSSEVEKKNIRSLTIGGFESVIDQADKTITFTVPESALSNGRLEGNISDLDADCDSLTFFIFGYGEYPNYQNGNYAGFSTGDKVYVPGGVEYTLLIDII